MNEKTKQQYLEQVETYMIENGVPNGADAAFFSGAEYVLNLMMEQ